MPEKIHLQERNERRTRRNSKRIGLNTERKLIEKQTYQEYMVGTGGRSGTTINKQV